MDKGETKVQEVEYRLVKDSAIGFEWFLEALFFFRNISLWLVCISQYMCLLAFSSSISSKLSIAMYDRRDRFYFTFRW